MPVRARAAAEGRQGPEVGEAIATARVQALRDWLVVQIKSPSAPSA